MEALGIGYVVIITVITFFICGIINKNTVGTPFAYIKRFALVWMVVLAATSLLISKLGLL